MKKVLFSLLVLALSACGAKANNGQAATDSTVDKTEAQAATEVRKPAPQFTLNDINGAPLSLSDLKGNWVILDFWGSWCPWCIKGFPALKEAYKEYDGKVVIVGIDCRDTQEVWKEAVRTHELPWIQLYCPDDSDLPKKYEIQGFPTKFIIDPEGNIANVTIGEDPKFFEVLKELVK